MESCRRILPTLLLLELILLSSGIMGPETVMVEAMRLEGMQLASTADHLTASKRICQLRSHRFRGFCFSRNNCGNVCRTEGFQFGHCRGLRRRCYCTKHC
ncbi:Defensin J1-2 [Apostasia shenzhenica]|uniref:Defensin J1-2 n=1 Tax=Apostasia shenzhenica TaxID=1088818 RepID=A0A2H9ZY75_9ASPA|nr:Defensin J1-2 [Apostasia shenzhenica]